MKSHIYATKFERILTFYNPGNPDINFIKKGFSKRQKLNSSTDCNPFVSHVWF